MAIIVKPFTPANGAIVDANELNAIFDTAYSAINGNLDDDNLANNAVTTVKILDGAVTLAKLADAVANRLVPIGSILWHYDYNGGLTFDASYWKYCNGQTHDFGGALGVQNLPDLSNRILIGFGTEAGGDIGSETWDVTVVGNANHEINLSHSHTVAGHTHTIPAHTHDVNIGSFTSGAEAGHTHSLPAHTHDVNIGSFTSGAGGSHSHTVNSHTHSTPNHLHTLSTNGWAQFMNSGGTLEWQQSAGVPSWTADNRITAAGVSASTSTGLTGGLVLDGSTDSDGSSTTGSASPGTDTEADHTHAVNPPNTTSDSGGSGTSGAGSSHTHAIDPPNTTSTSTALTTDSTGGSTDAQLSSPQSIKMRAIRARGIMRVV